MGATSPTKFRKRVPMPLISLVTELRRTLVSGGLGAADSAEYVRLFNLAADGQQ